jgi:hypothetical protein
MLRVSKKVMAVRNTKQLGQSLRHDLVGYAEALPLLVGLLWLTGRLTLSPALFAWNEVSWYWVCSYLTFPGAVSQVKRWQREVQSSQGTPRIGSDVAAGALVFLTAPLIVIGNLLVPLVG